MIVTFLLGFVVVSCHPSSPYHMGLIKMCDNPLCYRMKGVYVLSFIQYPILFLEVNVVDPNLFFGLQACFNCQFCTWLFVLILNTKSLSVNLFCLFQIYIYACVCVSKLLLSSLGSVKSIWLFFFFPVHDLNIIFVFYKVFAFYGHGIWSCRSYCF